MKEKQTFDEIKSFVEHYARLGDIVSTHRGLARAFGIEGGMLIGTFLSLYSYEVKRPDSLPFESVWKADGSVWLSITVPQLEELTLIPYRRMLELRSEFKKAGILLIEQNRGKRETLYSLDVGKLFEVVDKRVSKLDVAQKISYSRAYVRRDITNSSNTTKKNITTINNNIESTVASTVAFDSDQYVKEKLLGVKESRKDLWIIGQFAKLKKIKFKDDSHIQSFISQNIRAARTIKDFPDSDLRKAAKYCKKHYEDDRVDGGQDPLPWNLYTMGKILSSGVLNRED